MKEYRLIQLTGDFSSLDGLNKLQKQIELLRKHNEVLSVNISFARDGVAHEHDIATISYSTEIQSPCSYIGTSTTNTINGNVGYAKSMFSVPTDAK